MAFLKKRQIEKPSPDKAAGALRNFSKKAYEFFLLLATIIDTPNLRKKLPCARKNRFREAIVTCFRWLPVGERKAIKESLCWHLYCIEDHESARHLQMLKETADPRNFKPFKEWCKKRGRKWLRLASVYEEMVATQRLIDRESFDELWHQLSRETQGTLLYFWYHLFNCACHKVDCKRLAGETKVAITLTRRRQPILL